VVFTVEVDMHEVLLPLGWTSEVHFKHFLVIHGARYGFVTIDWKQRVYRLGISYSGMKYGDRTYEGRGWKRKLFIDAITALQEIQDGRIQ
jgi:hypothetical protein